MVWKVWLVRGRSIAFDLLISGIVAAFGLSQWHHPMAVPLALIMGAALLVRRRWPLAVMAVVAAAALVQVLYPIKVMNDPLPYDVAVPIAMYSVVKYAPRLRDGLIAAGVVTTGVVIEAIRHAPQTWWAFGPFMGAACAGVWMTAFVMRTRRRYVLNLEERAATLEREREALTRIAVAEERASIAREMHDVVAHSLAVIIVQADGGRYAMAADPETGRRTLETVAATGREALTEMRRLIDLLRSGSDHQEAASEDRVLGSERLRTLIDRARSAGLDVTLDGTGLDAAAGTSADQAGYRIVQESLTNVLRHAGPAASVRVTAERTESELRVSVVDDGGRAEGRPPSSSRVGHGLIGMRERVAVHGGSFAAGPYGPGWRVTAVIPIAVAGIGHTPAVVAQRDGAVEGPVAA